MLRHCAYEAIMIMARRKKKRKNTSLKTLAYIAALLLIASGAFSALKSEAFEPGRTSEADNDRSPGAPASARHYPALETVTLPDSLPQQVKEYAGFTVNFNRENKTPNYVAWELLDEESNGSKGRSNKFWTDFEIEGCPNTRDYTRSGYDRGHMCPAADQKWSREAMEDCFVMANICPQKNDLNSKAWKTLENKERQWAQRDSALVIIAGPVYSRHDSERIGAAGVRVPGAFFKVLLAPYVDEPRGIAFVYPNMMSPGNMQDYAMSIDELEEILGYDFFPALPDEIEKKVESYYSFKEWNRSRK